MGRMTVNKREITQLDILEWALEAITHTIGTNTGNPGWSDADWTYYYNAQKEVERRIRVSVTNRANHQRWKVPA